MKFKVGDKVKVVSTSSTFKKKYIGKTFTIRKINPNSGWGVKNLHYGVEGACPYVWFESELKLVNDEKIIITHDGKTTTATLYREDGSKEKATAKCNPIDEFDFNVGSKLALERLIEKTTKPKYFNGKVVCICTTVHSLTPGKIYTFVDGNAQCDTGVNVTCSPVKDINDLNSRFFGRTKFLPIVE